MSPIDIPVPGARRRMNERTLKKGCLGVIGAFAVVSLLLFALLLLKRDDILPNLLNFGDLIATKLSLRLGGLSQAEKADAQREISLALRTLIAGGNSWRSADHAQMLEGFQEAVARVAWSDSETREFLAQVRAFNQGLRLPGAEPNPEADAAAVPALAPPPLPEATAAPAGP